eukprot:4852564-Amphidinium_carterae.1
MQIKLDFKLTYAFVLLDLWSVALKTCMAAKAVRHFHLRVTQVTPCPTLVPKPSCIHSVASWRTTERTGRLTSEADPPSGSSLGSSTSPQREYGMQPLGGRRSCGKSVTTGP